jgi:nitrite reductase/ring-hydroxylating ferredoxin subunit
MLSEKSTKQDSTFGFEPPWYYAIREADLKEGKLLRAQAGGREFLLVKNEGEINVFSNSCPHAHCPLSTGKLEENILTCICHGRKFNIRTGECLNDSLKLKRYEWKIENENIGIKLE